MLFLASGWLAYIVAMSSMTRTVAILQYQPQKQSGNPFLTFVPTLNTIALLVSMG